MDVAVAAQQKADALQKQLDALNANSGNAVGLVNNLQQQLAGKQSELDELNRRYAEATLAAGQVAPTAGAGKVLAGTLPALPGRPDGHLFPPESI